MIVLAHGLGGGRSDLPVPLWMALYAGAIVVVVSFVVLGAFWSRSRFENSDHGRVLPTWAQAAVDGPVTRVGLRVVGLAAFLAVIVVALFGANDPAQNPAPTWVYVWLWVGLVPASLILGPVWRALNPLRSLAAGLLALLSGIGYRPQGYPQRWGYWPAVVSLLVFLWLELVYRDASLPRTVAVFLVVSAVVHVAAAVRFGPEWFERADNFEVYSTLLGHLAPVGRDSAGRLVVRSPFVSLASLVPRTGLVAVLCVLLGSTAFDGLTRTPWWSGLSSDTTDLANAVLGTGGLLGCILLVTATYTLASRGARVIARHSKRAQNPTALVRGFVHSLVPIVVGYTVAHYFSYFLFQGQAGYLLASDPLGRGWDLLGTADQSINYLLVSTQMIAVVQVGAIIVGHVMGVIAAHDRAVSFFARRDKLRGQYTLVTVMVLYTLGGIALVTGVG